MKLPKLQLPEMLCNQRNFLLSPVLFLEFPLDLLLLAHNFVLFCFYKSLLGETKKNTLKYDGIK